MGCRSEDLDRLALDLVRSAAARALADLEQPAAGTALLAALHSTSDPVVIAAILRALKSLRHEPAHQAALALLSHQHPAVRHEAVGLLGFLRKRQTLPEIARLALADCAADVRRQAVAALVSGERHAVAPTLQLTLRDPDWQVRAESAYVIGRLKISSALSALIEACGDLSWQVCEKAVEALGELRARQALPAIGLCAMAEISNLRRAAVASIGEIGDSEGRPYLAPALHDSDPGVRQLARWVLDRLDRAA